MSEVSTLGISERAQDDKQAVRHALERLGLHGGEDFEAAGRAWKALDRLTPRGVVGLDDRADD